MLSLLAQSTAPSTSSLLEGFVELVKTVGPTGAAALALLFAIYRKWVVPSYVYENALAQNAKDATIAAANLVELKAKWAADVTELKTSSAADRTEQKQETRKWQDMAISLLQQAKSATAATQQAVTATQQALQTPVPGNGSQTVNLVLPSNEAKER